MSDDLADWKKSTHPRWYYDACTLDKDRGIFAEIINQKRQKHPKICFFSHLALGEAYGNCFLKGKEQTEAFFELIESMRGFVCIVENDGVDRVFKEVREEFPRLGIMDAIHLATAIHLNCEILRTTDRDFHGLRSDAVKEFSKKINGMALAVTSKGI